MRMVFPLRELSKTLGQDIGVLKETSQLAGEPYKSAREEDGEYFNASYSFCDGVLEVSCDKAWKIRAIFIDATLSKAYEVLVPEFSMATSRENIRAQYGEPESCGERTRHAILGEYPAWDRFEMTDQACLVHLGYSADCTAISKLTIMPLDWEPGQS